MFYSSVYETSWMLLFASEISSKISRSFAQCYTETSEEKLKKDSCFTKDVLIMILLLLGLSAVEQICQLCQDLNTVNLTAMHSVYDNETICTRFKVLWIAGKH